MIPAGIRATTHSATIQWMAMASGEYLGSLAAVDIKLFPGGSAQVTIEEYVAVAEAANVGLRPQRVRKTHERPQIEARPSRAYDRASDDEVQSVDRAGVDERRYRSGAALDENSFESARRQSRDDGGRRDDAVRRRQHDRLYAGRRRTRRGGDNQPPCAVFGEPATGGVQPAARIDDDARRIAAGGASNGELRIVDRNRAGADEDRVDAGAQAMKVVEAASAVDVARFAAGGRDAAVERLAKLGDDKWAGRVGARDARQSLSRRP